MPRNKFDRQRAAKARKAIFSARGGSPVDHIEHAASAPEDAQPALVREAASALAGSSEPESDLMAIAQAFMGGVREEVDDEAPVDEAFQAEDDGSRAPEDVAVAAQVIAAALQMNDSLERYVRSMAPDWPAEARRIIAPALRTAGSSPSPERRDEIADGQEAQMRAARTGAPFDVVFKAAREHAALSARGLTRMSRDRYIEQAIQRHRRASK